MEEESRKIKTRWDFRGVGQWDGDTCVEEKKQEKKKKKGKETYESKKNKKSQLNDTIIFSQYFTINFK